MWINKASSVLAKTTKDSLYTLSKSNQLPQRFCAAMSTTKQRKGRPALLHIDNINPLVKNVEYAVRGPIVIRASEIEQELKDSDEKKAFSQVIKANIGDCHAMGQKPNTFIRQVIAACSYPPLIDQNVFPEDVNQRAKNILSTIHGSTGCYSDSVGLAIVRKHIAEFIAERDGYPSSFKDIIVTNGASSSVKLILELFQSDSEKAGIMIPIPQYPLYSATISEYGMNLVGYYLNEEKNWSLDVDELRRSLNEARKTCNPRVLCVINPGNPTGQVLTYDNIKQIIQFAMDENLFILADEVYQENVYGENCKFHSFKKVLMEMGKSAEGFQMASFHSCSKGVMGECGLRGGYVEMINLDDDVHYQLNKLQSANLGANVTGQLVMDCIVDPPKDGDPSYQLFKKETTDVFNSLKSRAILVHKKLNEIDGITCNEVMGAMYAFPRIHLPQKAIEKAKSLGQEPDFFYCLQMLEETGLCVVPGSGFVQKEGTYHFRMTILPPVEELNTFLQLLEGFHNKFMQQYKD